VGVQRSTQIGAKDSTRVGVSSALSVGKSSNTKIGMRSTRSVGMMSMDSVGLLSLQNIGGVYALTVGGMMNTAVAGMSREEVGNTKRTQVGKTYELSAGDSIKLSCGKSVLSMSADGTIELVGVSVRIKGKTIDHDEGAADSPAPRTPAPSGAASLTQAIKSPSLFDNPLVKQLMQMGAQTLLSKVHPAAAQLLQLAGGGLRAGSETPAVPMADTF
jgi:hypothetical protein